MIAHLSGNVLSAGASSAVVDVGGVGLHVLSTPRTLAQLRTGQRAELWTHLVVREESLTLYGFASAQERDAFVALQAVSGVGPKLAVSLLAVHAPGDLAAAIARGDGAALERVPGIGAKVAARLLLELGGKLTVHADAASTTRDAREDVVGALVGLGWGAKSAREAVDAAAPEAIEPAEVAETLRAALQTLGGPRG